MGLIAATALVHFLDPGLAGAIFLIAVFSFMLRAYGPANYGILAIAVTGLVVFLFAVGGVAPAEVIVPRGMNTLVGGLIALLAYRLWPTWERTQAPDALARMIDAYRSYFQSVRDGYLRQETVSDRTRVAGRIARSDLESSVARQRLEPGTGPERVALFDRILADSHRFIHAVMSLEAGLQTSRPVPPRDAFRKFSNDADLTLYYLAAALRGPAETTGDQFPDLREDYHALIESADSQVERHALVNTEADRIVNSLNTLREEILKLLTLR